MNAARWAGAVRGAVRALAGNALRSILTALGVIIGVAAVIALTALGRGSAERVARQVEQFGTNLLTVTPRPGFDSRLSVEDARALRGALGSRVSGVAPTVTRGATVRRGPGATNATVVGTWAAYATVRHAPVARGRFLTEHDEDRRARAAVLGHAVALALFGDADPLGGRVKIDGVSFEVVGVLPNKGDAGLLSPDTQVFVPLSTFTRRLGRNDTRGEAAVESITLQGARRDALGALEGEVRRALLERHRVANPSDADFQVMNQADALRALSAVNDSFTVLLVGVAGISLVVGGIGIMNIMLVSVTERTAEIGLRKALGATSRDILAQFLVEAVALCLGGGALGVALGLGVALVAPVAFGAPTSVSPASVLAAFAVSVAVGVVFGLYPAVRAARREPVEALRHG